VCVCVCVCVCVWCVRARASLLVTYEKKIVMELCVIIMLAQAPPHFYYFKFTINNNANVTAIL